MEIKGRTALITGGASGIGKAVARRFIARGARVVLWDLDGRALEQAASELGGAVEVRCYGVDITDRRGVAEAAEAVRREVGEVDILDNNAGIVCGGDFLSVSEESLQKTFDVNVGGVMWCTRAFLPGMIRRGCGHVVMMSSASGLLGVPGMAAYSASKHAVIGLAESLRLELRKAGHRGVGMTVVAPSFVKTGMFEGVRPPFLTPWLDPEALADKIVDAVARGRLYVREPFMVKLVPALKGFTSTAVVDWLGGALGMHRSMEDWKGR
ncbi:MAG: SDR family oxidoreductase [Elusimicrobia bacterium]|nr:SDR family oxidoreductase [Elusimicrobiota bacterium]